VAPLAVVTVLVKTGATVPVALDCELCTCGVAGTKGVHFVQLDEGLHPSMDVVTVEATQLPHICTVTVGVAAGEEGQTYYDGQRQCYLDL
jgi:hypothetical protein